MVKSIYVKPCDNPEDTGYFQISENAIFRDFETSIGRKPAYVFRDAIRNALWELAGQGYIGNNTSSFCSTFETAALGRVTCYIEVGGKGGLDRESTKSADAAKVSSER
ncbi:MAG: hypothetical protein VW498_02195 [Candidatus Thalassarchaeaceae archaeon]